jgi:hypothetical protein
MEVEFPPSQHLLRRAYYNGMIRGGLIASCVIALTEFLAILLWMYLTT